MSFYRIRVKDLKQFERTHGMLSEMECPFHPSSNDHCTIEHPECKAWQGGKGCCRQGVFMNAMCVLLAASAMADNGTVDNNLLRRILDNKLGGSWIEDGCLVIDMWDDDLGEVPLQHNPPQLMPC